MTTKEIKDAIDRAGIEIFTLSKYLEDKEMEDLHGERFRKMIKTLKLLITVAEERLKEQELWDALLNWHKNSGKRNFFIGEKKEGQNGD